MPSSGNVPLVSLISLKRSLVFPILLFPSVSLHCSLKNTLLSLLTILWNSAFRWVCLSFPPLTFCSLLFSAICKASSDNHFALWFFFFLGMILVTASCTVLWISICVCSGTLSIRSNPLKSTCHLHWNLCDLIHKLYVDTRKAKHLLSSIVSSSKEPKTRSELAELLWQLPPGDCLPCAKLSLILSRSFGQSLRASLAAQLVKNPPAVQETWVRSLGLEDPLEKGKATHSSIPAWRTPWTVYAIGSQRGGHDWVTFTSLQEAGFLPAVSQMNKLEKPNVLPCVT